MRRSKNRALGIGSCQEGLVAGTHVATGGQESEFRFSTGALGPSLRGSDPVPCRLT